MVCVGAFAPTHTIFRDFLVRLEQIHFFAFSALKIITGKLPLWKFYPRLLDASHPQWYACAKYGTPLQPELH